MARSEFIENLRRASRLLPTPQVKSGQGVRVDQHLATMIDSADLWLTPKSVEGFDPREFTDWSQVDQEKLQREVDGFLTVARSVPSKKPATKSQSDQARKHLEAMIKLVRKHLLPEWLTAQNSLVAIATAAAASKGWRVDKDEKDVVESLLGNYKAPRVRIRTAEQEVVLDPIAYFGSGQRGVVDLVVMPTYQTAYFVTYKDGKWRIVSPGKTMHQRPLTQATFVNTIASLRGN